MLYQVEKCARNQEHKTFYALSYYANKQLET